MKYVKYFVVVAVLLITVGILSGCGESEEDVLNEMPEGLYPMCEKGDFQELWGYVDETGEYVIEPQFLYADYFVKGIAVVQDPETKLYGYINKRGEYIFEQKFYCAVRFNKDGIAPVAIANESYPFGLWGYIDETGEFFIDPQFESAGVFVGNYAIVSKGDSKEVLIDQDLETSEYTQDTLEGWDFDEGPKLKYDKKSKKNGYVDSEGNWVIKPDEKFNTGENATTWFSDGLLAFETREKFDSDNDIGLYGFLNDKGEEVIPAQFCEVIIPFHNDVALVASPAKKDGEKATYGYINRKGKYLIEKEYTFDISSN